MISLEEEMPELTLEDKETLERKKVGKVSDKSLTCNTRKGG